MIRSASVLEATARTSRTIEEAAPSEFRASAAELPVTTDRFRYLPFLDGLRALSILAVLGFHEMGPISSKVASIVNGWVGVDVFFVISGFLITALLVQERVDHGTISFRGFYVRRILRIWPAYYAFLTFMLMWEGWKVSSQALKSGLFLTNIYLANFGESLGVFDHTWSLAVEEQFYLIWPVILYWSGRRATSVSLCIIGSVWVWRVILLFSGVPWIRLTGGFDTKIDSIMIGCTAALCWSTPSTRQRIRQGLSGAWTPWLLIAALFGMAQSLGHPSDLGFSNRLLLWAINLPIFTISVAILILGLLTQPDSLLSRIFSIAPLRWLGRLSYSLYLWHSIVFRELGSFIPRHLATYGLSNPYIQEVAKFGVSLMIAMISYYLIEIPFLRLKKGWVRVGARPIVSAMS